MKPLLLKNFSALFLLIFFTINLNAQDCSVNADLDQTICENETFFFLGSASGNVVSTTWSQIGGPSVVIVDPSSVTSEVLGMSGGNVYTFRLSAECDSGPALPQQIDITVEPISTATVGADIESCPDSSGSIVVTGSTFGAGETGMWSVVGTNNAGVIINTPTSPTTTLTLPETSCGVTTLRWTITGGEYAPGAFCTSYDELDITNFGGLEPVDAGPDQMLDNCYTVSQSTALNATNGGCGLNGQDGVWTFVSGPSTPTIADPNSNQTGISGLIEGVYVLRWSVSGPCANGEDTITITVDPATQDVTQASVQATNQFYCDGSVTTTTLIGNVPEFSGETVQWTQTGGPMLPVGSITNPTSPTTQVNNLVAPNVYTFSYTITNSATGCDSMASGTVGFNLTNYDIIVNGGNDIIGGCGETSIDIPFVANGNGTNSYSIVSGPADSAFSFPTAYQTFSGSSLVVAFDVEGVYTLAFKRSQTGDGLVGCEDSTDQINVSISLVPTGANAGTDQNLACGVVATTLAGNAITVGESLWTQISGPNTANILTPYNQLADVDGLIAGTYIFRYSVVGGFVCPVEADDVQITVNTPVVPVSNAGPDQTVCFGSPVQLNGNVPVGNQIGTWSQTAGPDTVTFSDVNDPMAVVTGITTAPSLHTFQWSIDGSPLSCGPPSVDTVDITANATQGPTPSNAGPDQCLPSGTGTVTLAGNAPGAGETGLWTAVPAGGLIFADDTQFNTTVTVVTEGSYILTWTIDTVAPGCQSATDEVEITIGGAAAADAGADQSVCSSTVTMAATTTGSGLWTQVSGPGGFTIDDDTSPVAIFTFTYSGTYEFDWAVNNGSCSSDSDQVTIEVGIPSTMATSGPAQVICNGTTAVLTANAFNPLTENGVWTVLSGAPNTPTFSNISDPNATVSGLVTGSYTFRWSISGSPLCPSTSADTTVDVFAPANAGPDQQLCEATDILLEATSGSTGTWIEVTALGSIITQTPANSNIANVTITAGNTYTFRFTTDYAGCPNLSDDVIVVNSSGPMFQPDAGPDQLLCQADLIPADTTTLAGNTPPADGTVAMWSFASVPSGSVAAIDTPSDPVSTLSGLSVPGIYILEWNFSLGNCPNNADVVRIEVFAPPSTAEAGPAQPAACLLTATMSATPPSVGLGVWSFVVDPSAGAAVIDSPNSPTSTISNITSTGTYTLMWTVSNGPFASPSLCAPTSDTVDITFTDVPPSPADAGPDQEFCDVTSTNMAAAPISPGIGTWSQTAGPGVTEPGTPASIGQINNPNSLIFGLVPGDYEFTWTGSNGGCDFSDAMLVTIIDAPAAANAGPDQVLPQFSNITLDAVPATAGMGTWTQESGPTTVGFIDENDPNTFVTGTTIGVYEFRWTVSNGICPTSFDIMQVEILGVTDLELTKTVLPTTASPGSPVTFTISIFNNDTNGLIDATGVEVEDVIPAGFTLISGTISNSGTYNPVNFTITWSGLSIPLATTLNLTFDATVNASGPYLNTAEITASDQADSDSTVNNNDGTEDDQDTASFTVIGDTDGDGTYDDVDPDPADPCNDDGVIGDEDTTNPIWQAADCDGDGETNGEEATNGTDPYDSCDVTNQTVQTNPMNPGSPEQNAYDIWAAADCDGDGVTNGVEAETDGTDPFNPCNYNAASQIIANVTSEWNALDCDGDGVTNGDEILEGTDPLDPCSFGIVNQGTPTSAWNLLDCDGDGVSNGQEQIDGTDPTDPCDFIIASQTGTTSATWDALDCDGDGDPNGTDPDPLDPCSATTSIIPLPSDPNYSIWAAADCDGDGVTNGDEVSTGSNPYDPCDYDSSVQNLSNVTAVWLANDCDGDGVSNGTEINDGTNPQVPCDYLPINQDITIVTPAWEALDCDGDGVTNGQEIIDGTDPLDPCDYDPTTQNTVVTVTAAWEALDCDGDGVTNGQEIIDGTNPLDPCALIAANQDTTPTTAWNDLDCDGDGVTNGNEIIDGTNPTDPCDFMASSATLPTTAAWEALDCDGDGVTNGQEIIDGTDPLDGCDLVYTNQTLPPDPLWLTGDCDGDGVTNGDEVADGTDPTDPCDYLVASQVPANVRPDWEALDCDGDGVTNGDELADGTNPLDPCDLDYTSQTLPPSQAWLDADCDGDGVTNGDEVIDGTDPTDPCDFMLTSQSVPTTPVWEALDCDGDGVSNGQEIIDGTDPLDPCDLIVANQDTTPTGAWNDAIVMVTE